MNSTHEKRHELPYAGGPLKLRIPFIHYRLEYQDFIQGAILSCIPLGITAAMVKVLTFTESPADLRTQGLFERERECFFIMMFD